MAAGVAGAVTLLASSTRAGQSLWPQWRGPTRDGQAPGPAWPDQLGTNALQLTWRVPLEPSYSGPIVGADRVFTTETKDKKTEVVTAYDRATGRQLWRTEWPGALSVPFFAKANGDWIRATPALDGDRLYVAGMRDVLVCLDARDGKEIWRKDFVKELATPVPDFGFVCSPLVDGDAVYVQAGAAVLRLNKETGAVVWRSLADAGGMYGSAFSSPVIATVAGRRQLLVQTRAKLAGVEPADGKELWTQEVPTFQGMNILTPLTFQDLVYTSTYGGKSTAYRITPTNGQFQVAAAWSHKAQGYMCTPVVVNGVAYEHLKSQRLMAIDLATGKEQWTSGEAFGKYASLVANGDRFLALDERGLLYLIRANPARFEIMDKRKIVESDTWAHLAVADDELYIRELHALSAYRWRQPK